MGEEDWTFLLETVFRTFIMFCVILTSLTLLGKRGVKQLSVFELVVIIGLGSAAGDPMFYKDVGILPALIVFTMIIGLYTFVTKMVGKYKPFEKLLEGKSICLIKEGVFSIDNFKKEVLAQDEFFAELRIKGISQLGQVEEAIEEVSGEISIFYFPDEKVQYGLPIMPNSLETKRTDIPDSNYYSCVFCGYTEKLAPAKEHKCPTCQKKEWVKASNRKRVV
ncbi:MAG: hypothetical protein JWQ96_1145 [Segetibacter sp.]|nr:hypothetical protein [Segetibacter sp.]